MTALQAHLLPRIKKMPGVVPSPSNLQAGNRPGGLGSADPGLVLIRNDRMYQHKVIRFNYTTYDVRRAQEVVNPNTSHANIMVLAQDDVGKDDGQSHKFWYAQVLGIYHVNAVYVGPGMVDYTPRRLDFLWVRWYRNEVAGEPSRTSRRLHRLSFPPMRDEDAFGFLDPVDVLRGCHIIPAFAKGRRHPNNSRPQGLSACAGDSKDWNQYYVGQ
jgi:hypothetical protein